MGALLGSRPLTNAERVRRHRALKAAAEVDLELRAFVLGGLDGSDPEAREDIAAFLAELPRELRELRHAVDALRKAQKQ